MNRFVFSFVVATILGVSSQAGDKFKDFSLGVDAGTTGIGITAVKKLDLSNDKWGVRIGYHQYSLSYDTTSDNTNYNFDLDLQDFQLMADYHPFRNSFKITFGALYNGTDLKGKIEPNNTTIVIDGTTYSTSQLGYVDTEVDFDNSIAPYLGIGWDTSFYKPNNSWGFTFDIGIAYTGSATVSYTPHYGTAIDDATKAEIEDSLERARISLQNDLDDYKFLPYVSLGFNYKF